MTLLHLLLLRVESLLLLHGSVLLLRHLLLLLVHQRIGRRLLEANDMAGELARMHELLLLRRGRRERLLHELGLLKLLLQLHLLELLLLLLRMLRLLCVSVWVERCR